MRGHTPSDSPFDHIQPTITTFLTIEKWCGQLLFKTQHFGKMEINFLKAASLFPDRFRIKELMTISPVVLITYHEHYQLLLFKMREFRGGSTPGSTVPLFRPFRRAWFLPLVRRETQTYFVFNRKWKCIQAYVTDTSIIAKHGAW